MISSTKYRAGLSQPTLECWLEGFRIHFRLMLAILSRNRASCSWISSISLFLCHCRTVWASAQLWSIVEKVIKSAVVPVAGHGIRLLPATKSQPKEMLPVARKPIVQYVVEELVSNGIQQILFVTGRSKASIENHFDHDPELFRALEEANKRDLLKEVNFADLKANFFYTRQRLQKGLGDAVLCGENFAGEEPFLVALGDSILGLNAVSRAVGRMVDIFDSKRASCVIAVEEVPAGETGHYGIVQ